jgi:hypothetical protein
VWTGNIGTDCVHCDVWTGNRHVTFCCEEQAEDRKREIIKEILREKKYSKEFNVWKRIKKGRNLS